MKLEKNDPDHDKKCEGCCLDKNTDVQIKIDTEHLKEFHSAFDNIRPIADSLLDVISKYEFSDLTTAIFCLNSWRKNRSALTQRLSLNMALSECGNSGTQHIISYSEFEMFYYEVSKFLTITNQEEYIMDDYGEVFINHFGKTYSTITGTGYQQVYGAIRHMQTLASICNRNEELSTILEYVNTIINLTKETNIPNSDHSITFEIPPEEYWNTITRMFNNPIFQKQATATSQIMWQQLSPIEMRHFIKKESKMYPLFNESILVDCYKILLLNATPKEKKEHITQTILSLVENSFNMSPNTPNRALIKPAIIDRKSKEVIVKGLLFATRCNENCILIVIDKNSYDDDQIRATIQQIADLNHTKGLRLAEGVYREDINGVYLIDFDCDCNIIYMIIDPFTDITANWKFRESSIKEFECSAIDAIYLIGFANNLNEVVEFIQYSITNQVLVSSRSGLSGYFFAWKDLNHVIPSGAIEYDKIIIDRNETEEYVYSYFKNMLHEFPRNNAGILNDPLNWVAEVNLQKNIRIIHKGCHGFGGEIKALGRDTYVFMSHNVDFFTKEDFIQYGESLTGIIDELNQRLFAQYADLVCDIDILTGKTLQILFMPWQYAINHSYRFLHDSSREIVFGDEHVEPDRIIIRYSLDPLVITTIFQNGTDLQAEHTYFLELLQPLCKYSPEKYSHLEKKLAERSSLKKTVGVFQIDQKYYFSDESIPTQISAISFTRVRKKIAKICFESGIKPGEYHGKEATAIIRKMQKYMVEIFEKYISYYDKYDLHNEILEYYSIQRHEITLCIKKYSALSELSDEVKDNFEKETIKIREECRRNIRMAGYLLESNLAIEHQKEPKKCSMEDFEFILAFADWLVVLQDCADICYYSDSEITVSISSEYKVDTILNEVAGKMYDSVILRKYDIKEYSIKDDAIDVEFLKSAFEAFNQDTGINIRQLILFMEYMQSDIIQDATSLRTYPNVFEIEKSELIQKYKEYSKDMPDYNMVMTIIDFLTLDTTALKRVNGKQHDVLPIWEREKRDNRFDMKPIIIHDNRCIFSPVTINGALESWKNGMLNWYLPYEIGLSKLKSVLDQWKKRYEDCMVQDIAQIFRTVGFDTVVTEVDLKSRFPQEDYPAELGDYDIIAISKTRHEVWIIESKVLHKVGSIYEDQMQQKSFFYQHKDDEKFQRRINYMMKNKNKILMSFGINDSEYVVVSYMVTNKLFVCRYKEIEFSIITYDELEKILKLNND